MFTVGVLHSSSVASLSVALALLGPLSLGEGYPFPSGALGQEFALPDGATRGLPLLHGENTAVLRVRYPERVSACELPLVNICIYMFIYMCVCV